MKRKQLLSLVLAGVMSLGMLAGCGDKESASVSKNENTATESENSGDTQDSKMEKIDVTVAVWGADAGLSGAEDPILDIIEEKTGVHLIPQNITWDDSEQKIQLWATNGQLPDIFAGDYVGKSFFYNWIEQGVIRALPEDLSDYPYLSEYLQMERAQAAMQDGKYYMIPRQTYGDISYSVLDRNIVYRWDLAQKAGVTKEPETWDEFREMIQKIIEVDPEGKNISGMTACQAGMITGVILPYGNIVEKKWVYNGEEFVPSYFDGDMIAAMQLARDMYEEGTIEKDIALTKIDTSNEKFLQGLSAAQVFAGSGPAWLYGTYEEYWQEMYGHSILDDVKIAKLYPGVDGDKYYFVDTESWSESYFSSNVNDEKMAAICRLYDFLYSEEGRLLVSCGIEGEDYDMVDGKPVMKEGVNIRNKYPIFADGSCVTSLAMWSADSWDMTMPSSNPEEFRQLNVERHQDAVENGTLPEYYDSILFLSTPLKDEFVINTEDDLLTIMMGTEPVDKMVNDLMENYESKGLSDMIKEVNEAAKAAGIEP